MKSHFGLLSVHVAPVFSGVDLQSEVISTVWQGDSPLSPELLALILRCFMGFLRQLAIFFESLLDAHVCKCLAQDDVLKVC